MNEKIIIKGAREHNLKNINLELPRNKLIVFTGLSGSGKSSLAFDTIFAEGQRRYVESLSAYARQFLGQMDKPDVDEIEGLSPAISIDQKSHSGNPRSTVATLTEIYDYLRVLFARTGKPFCPICGNEIRKMTAEEIVDAAIEFAGNHPDKELAILAPAVIGRKGEYYQLLYDFLNAGFNEVRINGEFVSLKERVKLSRYKQNTIELVVDKLPTALDFKNKESRSRVAEAVEAALKYGSDAAGFVIRDFGNLKPKKQKNEKEITEEITLSSKFSCPRDNFSLPEIEPRLFSFNSPYGACPGCHGLGTVEAWSEMLCGTCKGKRLKPEALHVLINNKNIADLTGLSIEKAYAFFEKMELKTRGEAAHIAEVPLREIKNRLRFMLDVGLDYLTLDRRAGTLSGGEAQRIRLASQIGSRLTGTLYVLDEPTIGLHQRDNEKLIKTLQSLRDIGNTVIVVEHDEDTIKSADHLVDIGPGAGVHGGEIVVQGSREEVFKKTPKGASATVDFLRGDKKIGMPQRRKVKNQDFLKLRGVTANNLKNIDIDLPLRRFVAVTGVSGSGKSTLVYDVIYKALANKFNGSRHEVGRHNAMLGVEYITNIIAIDQAAIGRTPRSNPATYVGAWGYIRDLFAATPEAKMRGFTASRFSFNVPGGRCEHCEGNGVIGIEMHFLPTVYVKCDVCKGRRFDRETLEVEYKNKNIHDVLRMTVEEAAEFFRDIPWVHDKLKILNEVGLGYLELGQSSTTLSGGEAQRIKLSAELGKRDSGRTLYVLDEPTTGLHFADIENLLKVLHRLVERGNTIVVIEHNLDVIKTADWVIDLGPEGGERGGAVVAVGTPEDVSRNPKSHTGHYLRSVLKK
jgi:excinuclease ABC subunit A